MVAGGESHSILVTTDGEVYGVGMNKDGQIGLGNTFEQFDQERRMKVEEERQKALEEQKRIEELIENQKQQVKENASVKEELKTNMKILKTTEKKLSQIDKSDSYDQIGHAMFVIP